MEITVISISKLVLYFYLEICLLFSLRAQQGLGKIKQMKVIYQSIFKMSEHGGIKFYIMLFLTLYQKNFLSL